MCGICVEPKDFFFLMYVNITHVNDKTVYLSTIFFFMLKKKFFDKSYYIGSFTINL